MKKTIHILLFFLCSIFGFSQNTFNGINYQAVIDISLYSDLRHSDFSKIYFEISSNENIIYSEEQDLKEFKGKIDLVLANSESFKTILYNEASQNSDFYLSVYVSINGVKQFIETQKIQSHLYSNISKYNLEKKMTTSLFDANINTPNNLDVLAFKNNEWKNIKDESIKYGFIHGGDTISLAKRTGYAFKADSTLFSDTVRFADTVLYDVKLDGNIEEPIIGTNDLNDLVLKTNDIKRIIISSSGAFFINKSSSVVNLDILGEQGMLFENNPLVGSFPTLTYPNIFMWSPKGGNLRIGTFENGEANESNMKLRSFSFGKNNIARGSKGSTVFGFECLNDSLASIDFGYDPNDPSTLPGNMLHDFFTEGSYAFTGGYQSEASGTYSFSFGYQSKARFWRTVAMGYKAVVDGRSAASIAIGYDVKVLEGDTQTANCSAFGINLTAIGSQDSFILGSNASTNNKWGVFNYADNSTTNILNNTADNQFIVRSTGGVVFYTSEDLTTGAIINPGSGTWSLLSNKKTKTNIFKLKPNDYYNKINYFSLYNWEYKTEKDINHIGFMAQDFYSLFQLGSSNKYISMIDSDGITLLTIKALDGKIDNLEKIENNLTKSTVPELSFADIEKRIMDLENKIKDVKN